jgi:hypothetical protein
MPSRRTVLKWSGSAGMLAVAAVVTPSCAAPTTDAAGLVLPVGFSARVVARAGDVLPGGLRYRIFPDGAATFPDAATPGGWYLVVNHEVPGGEGGVTSLRFAPGGALVGARSICAGTSVNCAGGATPWGTWLTCEEWDGGLVFECDPTGEERPVVLAGLGRFAHEAAAVAADDRVYLTEDRRDGCLYRFTPTAPGDLTSGVLEVAVAPGGGAGRPGTLSWAPVPDPWAGSTPCRYQVPEALHFDGGEGAATNGRIVWFTTKGDLRVWSLDVDTGALAVHHQGAKGTALDAVDNIWCDDASGALFVAEDGGNMEVVIVRPDGSAESFVRIPGHENSEVAGPCFSPDGQRLYFSSQRGPDGVLGLPTGVTYEVTGPFDELLGR